MSGIGNALGDVVSSPIGQAAILGGVGLATGGLGDAALAPELAGGDLSLDALMGGADAGTALTGAEIGSAGDMAAGSGLLADTGAGAGAAINGAGLLGSDPSAALTGAEAGTGGEGQDMMNAAASGGLTPPGAQPSLLSQLGKGLSTGMKYYGIGNQAMTLAGMNSGAGMQNRSIPTSMMNRGSSGQPQAASILGNGSGVIPGQMPGGGAGGGAGVMAGMMPQGMPGAMPGGMSNALSSNPQMMMMMMQRMQQQGMLGGGMGMGGM